ncbi:MAG: DUF1624 domain-containing protein, partial [Clostridia bacterium]|nr:DUF1624 domain-containing protein [Clostridia bacterium]
MINAQKAEKRALKKEKLTRRVTELDMLRGICILLMLFDHTMYDFFGVMPDIFPGAFTEGTLWHSVRDFAATWWTLPFRVYGRLFVVFIFLSLTGISFSFSRSNLKRGFKLLGLGLVLTAGTTLADAVIGLNGRMIIVFGILHLMGTCVLIATLIEKLTARLPDNKWVYLIVGAALVIAGAFVHSPVGLFEYPVNAGDFFGTFFAENGFLDMFGQSL